ncbi:MAG TPA: prenyltransferase/squalene oxidase repeat-containing protein [Lacipirellulaceae bacterium]|nr:prenyltransferase/squalene oxidase repeat-containing protein [Lacipirellulaceae bacterium]
MQTRASNDRNQSLVTWMLAGVIVVSANQSLAAKDTDAAKVDAAAITQATNKAADFLKQSQASDGSFSSKAGPGVTAIVAAGLLRSGKTVDDPVVAKALKYLDGNHHEDGGIYQTGGNHKNYETCLAIIAYQAANGDHRYDKLLADAEKFVKKEQWDEDEGKRTDDVFYGGAGYGSSSRPDLSNTSFLIDALHAVGRGEDDPAMQKAIIFVSRCQNLESKYNTLPFAGKVNDGGFIYTPVADAQNPAGKTDDGGLRSYGSMTYAGFKSMIYAGVKRDDPRVKAAYAWIQKNYTLDENPNMGPQGLFYYYHTFAKALDAIGDDKLVDAKGNEHNWRAELAAKYIAAQQPDGSWVNKTPRWMEGDANLVTAYGLLCLSYCKTP